MKKFLFIFTIFLTNLVLFGQQTGHVLNVKLYEKSSQSIIIAWVADAEFTDWEIRIDPSSASVNFIPISANDLLAPEKSSLQEPNVYYYRFNNLLPETTYNIFVKVSGEPNEVAQQIEVTTNRTPSISIDQSPYVLQDVKCSSFRPILEKTYLVSAWIKKDADEQSYVGCGIVIRVRDDQNQTIYTNYFEPVGQIIDGWQRVEGEFRIPQISNIIPEDIDIVLVNDSNNNVYFDDIRIFPKNGNLKSYVYDFETKKLRAELDQNNYATFYEYDQEGGLVRIKKETERGIFTIQETRSHTRKQPNNSN